MALKKSRSEPLRQSFDNNLKILQSDITKLRSIIADPMESLRDEIKRYNQIFPKLIALTSSLARSQASQGMLKAQLGKALEIVDNRLQSIQAAYIEFREKFKKYCIEREAVFTKADILLNDSGMEIRKILEEASKIDSEMFDPSEIENKINEKNIEPGFWKTPSSKKKKNEPFFVTVDREIQIENQQPIHPKDKLVVINAVGDDWELKNKDGEVCHVPLEYLVPI